MISELYLSHFKPSTCNQISRWHQHVRFKRLFLFISRKIFSFKFDIVLNIEKWQLHLCLLQKENVQVSAICGLTGLWQIYEISMVVFNRPILKVINNMSWHGIHHLNVYLGGQWEAQAWMPRHPQCFWWDPESGCSWQRCKVIVGVCLNVCTNSQATYPPEHNCSLWRSIIGPLKASRWVQLSQGEG